MNLTHVSGGGEQRSTAAHPLRHLSRSLENYSTFWSGYAGQTPQRLPTSRAQDNDLRQEVIRVTKELSKPVILGGDFNVIAARQDIYDFDKHAQEGGFSPAERENFQKLLACGLVDAMRERHPPPLFALLMSLNPPMKNVKIGDVGWR